MADGRHIGNRAREEAENYRDTYRAPTPVKVILLEDHNFDQSRSINLKFLTAFITQALADRIGLYVQAYTLYSSVRPFGISAIFGGIDTEGPQLYVVEPSGIFYVSRFPARGYLL